MARGGGKDGACADPRSTFPAISVSNLYGRRETTRRARRGALRSAMTRAVDMGSVARGVCAYFIIHPSRPRSSRRGRCARFPSGVRLAALAAAVIAGACLMAAAVAARDLAWLGWLCLLPVFIAIRYCPAGFAGLCGGLWGGSLQVFLMLGTSGAPAAGDSFIATSAGSDPVSAGAIALLVGIPALYAYLAARLTRWLGFSPLVLGVAWIGVELALSPLGLRYGLLAGTQSDGTLMAWIGQGLGYALVAFIVAIVNASLTALLFAVRFELIASNWCNAIRDLGASVIAPMRLPVAIVDPLPSQPRAPPIH